MGKFTEFWMADGDPILATTRIAIVSASLVILAAGALGFTALYDLFVSIGLFHPGLAILFPLLFDFAEITAAVIVLNAKLNGEDDRLAWRAVLLFTGLGILANIAHAVHAAWLGKIDVAQAGLAVVFTMLFPVSIALVTHLLKSVIERSIKRNSSVKTLAALAAELKSLTGSKAQLEAQKAQLEAQLEAQKAQLEAQLLDLETAIETATAELETRKNQARLGVIEPDTRLVQAYQIDGFLAAGGSQVAAAEIFGLSDATVRNRLKLLNGSRISK